MTAADGAIPGLVIDRLLLLLAFNVSKEGNLTLGGKISSLTIGGAPVSGEVTAGAGRTVTVDASGLLIIDLRENPEALAALDLTPPADDGEAGP